MICSVFQNEYGIDDKTDIAKNIVKVVKVSYKSELWLTKHLYEVEWLEYRVNHEEHVYMKYFISLWHQVNTNADWLE